MGIIHSLLPLFLLIVPNVSFFSNPLPSHERNDLLLLVNKTYKDGAGSRVGLNFTIRQGAPRAGQVGAALTAWPITRVAAQVTVCSKGLSRAITHLERKER